MTSERTFWLASALVLCAALAIASAPWALAMPVLNWIFKPLASLWILGTYWSAQWCIASWLKPR